MIDFGYDFDMNFSWWVQGSFCFMENPESILESDGTGDSIQFFMSH